MTTTATGIWSPDAADDYALTTDLAAMAASIDTAITNELNTGLDQKGSAVSNYTALPALGNTPGDHRITNDTRILWTWDGTRWIPTAGRLPWAHVWANDFNLTTASVAVSFPNGSSSGLHNGGTNFTVPAGCGGLYLVSFNARHNQIGQNLLVDFNVNGGNRTGSNLTATSQEYGTLSQAITLNASDVLQIRARYFSGTGALYAGASASVSFLHSV